MKRDLSNKETWTILAILLVVLAAMNSDTAYKVWVHMISPFDRRPTTSMSEIISSKGKNLAEHREELCAWLKREQIRNPSIFIEANLENCK